MRLPLRLGLFALALYLGFYVRVRNQWREVWDQDGKPYVIYPLDSKPAYFLFRPLGYVDQWTTGTGSHLGPHR